jgi:uncharacterized SAM-binding protein YcdF (DUF218 family)
MGVIQGDERVALELVSKRSIAIVSSCLLLVGASLFQMRERVLSVVGDYLVVQDKLEVADVIHVIAGPDEYTDYAVQLYQQGYGKQIFFTGGWCREHGYYHGDHGRRRAVAQGVPPEAIATDDSHVMSTYSEVIRLEEVIRQSKRPIQSVISVSDPYHMRRARWTYRQVLGDKIQLCMAPIPSKLSVFKHVWWQDSASRQMVKDEYLKILYYYARYKFSWGLLKEWLASLDRD